MRRARLLQPWVTDSGNGHAVPHPPPAEHPNPEPDRPENPDPGNDDAAPPADEKDRREQRPGRA